MTTSDNLTKRLEAKEQIYSYLRACHDKYNTDRAIRKSVAKLQYLCERTMSTLNLLDACWKNNPATFESGTEYGWRMAINAETISRISTCLAATTYGSAGQPTVTVRVITEIAMLEVSPLTPPVNHYHVYSFMRDVGQSTPAAPTVPDDALAKLRSKLQVEETLELVSGLGADIELVCDGNHDIVIDAAANTMKFRVTDSAVAPTVKDAAGNKLAFSWREVVDGLNDIGVIADGTVIALGLSPYLVQLCRILVDISNLDKFDEGSYMREDGKWMKQPNWVEPPIAAALALFGIDEEAIAS